MKVLILSASYPSIDEIYAYGFVHSRCLEYLKYNIEVDVISFKTKDNYIFEGVNVYNKDSYIKLKRKVDLVVSHAPNIKNHMRFLFKYYSKLPIVFFFHGHEVMDTNKYYPRSFEGEKNLSMDYLLHYFYDPIKLKVMKYLLLKLINSTKIKFVFVSEWMKDIAYNSMKLSQDEKNIFNKNSHIVHNGVNKVFIEKDYTREKDTLADFITIRPFDNPKYGIDIVYKIAKDNPQYTFHIYGKGSFFKNKKRLNNLMIFNEYILQKDIPKYLNKYKTALMPTRLDAQGVMMCEIATYNMPLITSDIKICHEMLNDFKNVNYISNIKKVSLDDYIIDNQDRKKEDKFNIEILALDEINIYKELLNVK